MTRQATAQDLACCWRSSSLRWPGSMCSARSVHAILRRNRNNRAPPSFRLAWSLGPGPPARRGDVALAVGGIIEVIGGDKSAVGRRQGARIADVVAAAAGAKHDLLAPALALVAADPGRDPMGLVAVAISQHHAAVFKPGQ